MDDKLVPIIKGKNARKRDKRRQKRIEYEKMLDSLCGMDSMTPEERMKFRIQRDEYKKYQESRSPAQKEYDAWFDRSSYSSYPLPTMYVRSAQRSSYFR